MEISITYTALNKDRYMRAIKLVLPSIYFDYNTFILYGPPCSTPVQLLSAVRMEGRTAHT